MFFIVTSREISTKDQELVQKSLQGDEIAFGQLYQKYAQAIYRYIYFKVESSETAQDLTQDTFFKIFKNLQQHKNGTFKAWMYSIARNTVIDYWRKKSRRKQASLEQSGLDQLLPSAENLEHELETKSEVQRLKAATAQLKTPYQEVIELRFFAHLSIEEVATLLGKKEGWVRVNTFRAVKKLKQLLDLGV